MQIQNNMLAFLPINLPQEIKKHCFKFNVIQLDQQTIDYLLADSIFISEHWRKNAPLETQEEDQCPRFAALETMLLGLLEEYDEKVFIKLNWWAPRDCQNWIPDLKFESMHDIFSALKTSGLLMEMVTDYSEWLDADHKLQQFRRDQIQQQFMNGYFIEVRKWYPLNHSQEFRCFVHHGKLKGICQKHLNQIKKLSQEEKHTLEIKITTFIVELVIPHFKVDDFVVDIYIDIPPKERVIIVGLNPWREFTQSKLFTYEELESPQEVTLRLVQCVDEITQEDFSSYRMPSEFTELDNQDQMIDLLQQMCQQQQ